MVTMFLLGSLVVTSSKALHRMRRTATVRASGNGCPESSPWPCKTPDNCLSFDYICDGEPDCPDKYDEDPNLCTAKERPAPEILAGFVRRYKNWLIPKFLGPSPSPEEAARSLIESKNWKQYSERMQLTPQQSENLFRLMDGVRNGRQIDMLILGMPTEAWNDMYFLFKRIADSGFLDA